MNEVNWLSKILDMYLLNIFLLMILSLNFLLTNCEHFSLLFLVQFYYFPLGSMHTLFIKIFLLVNLCKNVCLYIYIVCFDNIIPIIPFILYFLCMLISSWKPGLL